MSKRTGILVVVPLLIAAGLGIWALPSSGFDPTPTSPTFPFSGYTTGTPVHAGVILAGTTQVLNAEVAWSGASGASLGTDTVTQGSPTPVASTPGIVRNEMGFVVQPNLPAAPPFLQGDAAHGSHTYGRGSGLEVGIGTDLTASPTAPAIPVNKAEVSAPATIPCPTAVPGGSPLPPPACHDLKQIGPVPASPLAYASLLKGQAAATWRDDICATLPVPFSPFTSPFASPPAPAEAASINSFSVGTGEATNVQLIETGTAQPNGQMGAPAISLNGATPDRDVSRSSSVVGHTRNTALSPNRMLVSTTRMTVAPITLNKGMPGQVTIEVLGEWAMSAWAGGSAGGAGIQYGPDPSTPLNAPVIRVLTDADGSGPIPPVVAAEILAAQALNPLSLDLPPGVGPYLLRLSIGENPHAIGAPGTAAPIALDGTSASGAVDVVRLQLLAAPPDLFHLAELRVGHMEARAAVAPGGIQCPAPQADLGITKSHTPATFQAGQAGTYNLAVTNAATSPSPTSGPCPPGVTAPGPASSPCGIPVVVIDDLPPGMTLVPGSATGGWVCSGAAAPAPGQQRVTCTNGTSIPVGGTSNLTFLVNVNPTTQAQCVAVNQAVVPITFVPTPGAAAVNNGGVQEDTTAPDATTANNVSALDIVGITGGVCSAGPDLTITKTHAPATLAAGGPVNYTLRVSNAAAPATAATGTVTVTDTQPAGVTFTGATGVGWVCAGTTTITCVHPGPVAPGTSLPDITVTGTVAAAPPACVNNSASVANATDGNGANNTANDVAPTTAAGNCVAVGGPDLSITKAHAPATFAANSAATYTLTVANAAAPATATTGAITVTDTLPTGLTFVSGTGAGWTCAAAGQVVTCTNPGPLAAGATSAITLNVTVGAACTSFSNTATVATTGDSNAANNTSPADVATCGGGAGPDMNMRLSHNPSTFSPGGTGTIQINSNNVGTVTTTGTTTITVTLPTGLTFQSAVGDKGFTCTATGQTVTCSSAQPLPPGDPVIIITVLVAPTFPGGTVTATVATANDTNAANNTAQDFIPVGQNANQDLAIVKSHSPATWTAGQQAAWLLTVSNVGVTNSTGTLTVTDTLPQGVTPTQVFGSGWTCQISGQSVTCTTTGVLAPATSSTITVLVNVAPNISGVATNTAVVNPGDPNPGNNTSTDQVAINPPQQQQQSQAIFVNGQAYCQTQGQMVIAPSQSRSSNNQEQQQSVQRPGSNGAYSSSSQEQEQSKTSQGVNFTRDQCGNTVIAPYQHTQQQSSSQQQQTQGAGTAGAAGAAPATQSQPGGRVQATGFGTGGPTAPAAPPASAVRGTPRFTG